MITRRRSISGGKPSTTGRSRGLAIYLALWTRPEDVEGFEREYSADHIPRARELPGLRRLRIATVHDGSFYRAAELEFDSVQELQAALGESEAGERLIENSRHLQQTYSVTTERIIMDGWSVVAGSSY
ncbi:MAG: EthD family reductase [Pseudonocardiaceae bacterium]|nr:EthD family reductase [Pseudonocardiaceae bacterium]